MNWPFAQVDVLLKRWRKFANQGFQLIKVRMSRYLFLADTPVGLFVMFQHFG
jgi:hypothetical protein